MTHYVVESTMGICLVALKVIKELDSKCATQVKQLHMTHVSIYNFIMGWTLSKSWIHLGLEAVFQSKLKKLKNYSSLKTIDA